MIALLVGSIHPPLSVRQRTDSDAGIDVIFGYGEAQPDGCSIHRDTLYSSPGDVWPFDGK